MVYFSLERGLFSFSVLHSSLPTLTHVMLILPLIDRSVIFVLKPVSVIVRWVSEYGCISELIMMKIILRIQARFLSVFILNLAPIEVKVLWNWSHSLTASNLSQLQRIRLKLNAALFCMLECIRLQRYNDHQLSQKNARPYRCVIVQCQSRTDQFDHNLKR